MICEKFWSRYSSERPYLFFYKRRESIHILGSAQYINEAEAEDFIGGFDNHLQLDNQQRNIVFGISLRACDERT